MDGYTLTSPAVMGSSSPSRYVVAAASRSSIEALYWRNVRRWKSRNGISSVNDTSPMNRDVIPAHPETYKAVPSCRYLSIISMPPESATGTSGITTCELAIHCAPSHHHWPSSENMCACGTDCVRTLRAPARSPRLQQHD